MNEDLFRAIMLSVYGGLSIESALTARNVRAGIFWRDVSNNGDWSSELSSYLLGMTDHFANEIINIADSEDDPKRARNRIDARKWYASKMNPKKYGDKINVEVQHFVDIAGALSEARQRVVGPALAQSQVLISQCTDIPMSNDDTTLDCISSDDKIPPDIDIFEP